MMKTYAIAGSLMMVGAVAMLQPAPVQESPPIGVTLAGKVVNIVDGDTLDVETRLVIRLRLDRCWSPESRTKDLAEKARGIAAKENLKRLAEGKDCKFHIPMTNRLMDSLTLDRVLGSVWCVGDSLDLSTLQVEQGHATREKQK